MHMARYFIGFLLAVGLIVVVIVLIIRGLSSSSGPKPLDLNSYATTNVTVQLTIDSPVAASATHRDIIINVGSTESSLTVTQGYQHSVVRMQSYPMNVASYADFLHALTVNGFTKGNNDPSLKDERGQCALGDRFVYEAIDSNGNDLQRYWRTSCGTGTFQGDAATIRQLFVLQIPDYDQLTADVDL